MRRRGLLVSYITVQFDPYAKTGNRLCQLAFGKILADKKNIPLYSSPIPGFINTYNYNTFTPQSTPTINTLQFGAHIVDYNFLLNTEQPICVNSYLQKISYYQDHLDVLKSFYYIENNIEIDKDELVIHIRDTDYRGGNVHIRENIYLNILNDINPTKISIVTDNIKSPTVEMLCNHGAKIVTQSNTTNAGNGLNSYELYDFLYMLKANLLLISQSTFSWWASFLGNQEKVFVPYDLSNQSMWKLNPEKDDIDLIPTDKKFIKLVYE
jgi:hypothetical protein